MKKIILKANIGLHEGYPTLCLSDEAGATLIGSVLWNSVESLAREYQKDFEYNRPKDNQYYVIFEGQTEEIHLFQKPIVHGYGEPNTYEDLTNL